MCLSASPSARLTAAGASFALKWDGPESLTEFEFRADAPSGSQGAPWTPPRSPDWTPPNNFRQQCRLGGRQGQQRAKDGRRIKDSKFLARGEECGRFVESFSVFDFGARNREMRIDLA